MTPKVSVIITSYNRPLLVTDAIESCLEQTMDEWELIVADDDSNPETVEAIWRASRLDPRIVVMQKAAGPVDFHTRSEFCRYCMTINEALKISKGEYLTYIPDDDYLYPNGLKARADVLDANPEVHVVYSKMRSISYDVSAPWDTLGRPKAGRSYPKEGEIDPATGKKVDIASWFPGYRRPLGGHVDHGQIMHRRCCLTEMGGPPWWPVVPMTDVGDAAFFRRLDLLPDHAALAVDEVCHTKRFHGTNFDKARFSEIRE